MALLQGGGARRRAIKPPDPLEEQIHITVADALQWCKPGWRYTHIPNGEHRDIRTAMKLKRMGVKRGWPDFMLFHREGKVCGLELKRRNKKPSDAQFDVLAFLKTAGHEVAVADNIDLALAILKRWGVL